MVSSSARAASKSLIVGSTPYLTIELSAVQRHRDALAGIDRRGVANDSRPVLVPTHRVPATEDGERAQALEPRHGAPQAVVLRMTNTGEGRPQPSVVRDQARANAFQ